MRFSFAAAAALLLALGCAAQQPASSPLFQAEVSTAGFDGHWSSPAAGQLGMSGMEFSFSDLTSKTRYWGFGSQFHIGYERVGRYPGGNIEGGNQLLFAPLHFRSHPTFMPLLFAEGDLGTHIGGPYHYFADGGVGVDFFHLARFVPFVEMRWRLPLTTSQWRMREWVAGIRLIGNIDGRGPQRGFAARPAFARASLRATLGIRVAGSGPRRFPCRRRTTSHWLVVSIPNFAALRARFAHRAKGATPAN